MLQFLMFCIIKLFKYCNGYFAAGLFFVENTFTQSSNTLLDELIS